MKYLIVLSALVAAAMGDGFYATPGVFKYGAVPFASQYHAQDNLGQYSYGYSGGASAKSEVRSVDGSVAGGYSYVDPQGELQSVKYTADSVHGFRVAATNLPVVSPVEKVHEPVPVHDTPEVTKAKIEHFAAVEEVKSRKISEVVAPVVSPLAYTIPHTYSHVVPAVKGYAYSAHTVHHPEVKTFVHEPKVFHPEVKTFVHPEVKSFAYDTKVVHPEFKSFVYDPKIVVPEVKTYVPEVKTYFPEVKTYVPEVKTYVPEVKTYAVPEVKSWVYPEVKTYYPEVKTYVPEVKSYAYDVKTYAVPEVKSWAYPEVKTYVPEVKTYYPEVKTYVPEVKSYAYAYPDVKTYAVPEVKSWAYPEVKTYVPEVKTYYPEVKTYVPEVKSYAYAYPDVKTYAVPEVKSWAYPEVKSWAYPEVKSWAYPEVKSFAYAAPVTSQFHSQDNLGQYSYGYAGGLSAKAETKSFDGVTRGGYSFVDANNKLQTVQYTADAVNGYQVAATNLPVNTVADTPEVAAAKAAHFAAHEDEKVKFAKALY